MYLFVVSSVSFSLTSRLSWLSCYKFLLYTSHLISWSAIKLPYAALKLLQNSSSGDAVAKTAGASPNVFARTAPFTAQRFVQHFLLHKYIENTLIVWSRIWGASLIDGVWIGYFIYWQHSALQIFAALSLIYILYSSALHTHTHTHTHTGVLSPQQSYPLNVSQHSSYTSHTITAAQIKSSSYSLIPFLSSVLNHLLLPSQENPSIIILLASGRPQQETLFRKNSSIFIEVCSSRRCTEKAFLLLLHACSFSV
jgi:hypothetical protein